MQRSIFLVIFFGLALSCGQWGSLKKYVPEDELHVIDEKSEDSQEDTQRRTADTQRIEKVKQLDEEAPNSNATALENSAKREGLLKNPPQQGPEITTTNATRVLTLLPQITKPIHSNNPHCSRFNISNLQPAYAIQSNNKPTFIIHVGPSKTASTTLQEETRDLETCVLKPLDNYIYIGFKENGQPTARGRKRESKFRKLIAMRDPFSRKCFDQWQQLKENNQTYSHSECWNTMKQELDRYSKQGVNVILSDEQMCWHRMFLKAYARDSYFEAIREALQDHWNVMVVVAYRRHSEWALSAIKEQQSRGQGGCLTRSGNPPWPGQQGGGSVCAVPWATLSEWRSPTGKELQTKNYRYTDELYRAWTSHGFRTKVLNLHLPGQAITETFYCDILEDAPYACQYTRARKSDKIANSKSAATLFYDTIAVAAAAKEPWGRNLTKTPRGQVVQELIDFHQTTLGLNVSHLPLNCPTEEEAQQYLQLGLNVEQQLLPDFYASPLGEAQHREAFRNMAEVKKGFCHVNTKLLFESCSSWEDVKKRMAEVTSW